MLTFGTHICKTSTHVRRFISGIQESKDGAPKHLVDSAKYWEERYAMGGNSGAGSYNQIGVFKVPTTWGDGQTDYIFPHLHRLNDYAKKGHSAMKINSKVSLYVKIKPRCESTVRHPIIYLGDSLCKMRFAPPVSSKASPFVSSMQDYQWEKFGTSHCARLSSPSWCCGVFYRRKSWMDLSKTTTWRSSLSLDLATDSSWHGQNILATLVWTYRKRFWRRPLSALPQIQRRNSVSMMVKLRWSVVCLDCIRANNFSWLLHTVVAATGCFDLDLASGCSPQYHLRKVPHPFGWQTSLKVYTAQWEL